MAVCRKCLNGTEEDPSVGGEEQLYHKGSHFGHF